MQVLDVFRASMESSFFETKRTETVMIFSVWIDKRLAKWWVVFLGFPVTNERLNKAFQDLDR